MTTKRQALRRNLGGTGPQKNIGFTKRILYRRNSRTYRTALALASQSNISASPRFRPWLSWRAARPCQSTPSRIDDDASDAEWTKIDRQTAHYHVHRGF